MHKLMGKLILSLIALCLATSSLCGQVTQLSLDTSAFALENGDEELDNLIAQAIQGDEKAIEVIEDYALYHFKEIMAHGKF